MIWSLKHESNTCMACETITNQFLDLKNPHLESKNMKICIFWPIFMFFDYAKNMCLTHVGHMWGTWNHHQSISWPQKPPFRVKEHENWSKYARFILKLGFFWDTLYEVTVQTGSLLLQKSTAEAFIECFNCRTLNLKNCKQQSIIFQSK